jgi:tRNA(Arg) A34 adenosine deaminase TadA
MADHDPTAHAEVVAMRDACARRNGFSLAGCTLVASGEPCALCYTAALWFNVERIVFAVDRHGAAAAGFDYSRSYDLFAEQPARWPLDVRLLPVEGGERPFDRWRELNHR